MPWPPKRRNYPVFTINASQSATLPLLLRIYCPHHRTRVAAAASVDAMLQPLLPSTQHDADAAALNAARCSLPQSFDTDPNGSFSSCLPPTPEGSIWARPIISQLILLRNFPTDIIYHHLCMGVVIGRLTQGGDILFATVTLQCQCGQCPLPQLLLEDLLQRLTLLPCYHSHHLSLQASILLGQPLPVVLHPKRRKGETFHHSMKMTRRMWITIKRKITKSLIKFPSLSRQ